MITRKLVKSGFSSLVVAMPKEWVDSNKLKAGDTIYLDLSGDNISIRPDYKKPEIEKKEIVIDVDGKNDRIISRDINSAYLDNYYYIILKGKEIKKKVKMLKSMISSFIALEIIDESSEKIVAKSFLNIYDSDIKLIVRRMDNIIRSMIIDTKQAVTDPELSEAIMNRDFEVNRLNLLVSKIIKISYKNKNISRSIGLTEMDILRYLEINLALEKIGDRIKHIAMLAPKIKPAYRKPFLELFNQIEEMYTQAMKAFYSMSPDISDHVSNMRAKVLDNISHSANDKCPACLQVTISEFNLVSHINDIGRIVRYLD